MNIIAAAFLAGYMNKEAAEPTSYDSWLKDTGSSTHYNAVSDAEHRGSPNTRFIRAMHAPGGTAAYGPVQVNKTYLKDFGPTGRYKDVLSDSPRQQAYLAGLTAQASKFLRHGNMKGKLKGYDPKYGYSNKAGTGLGDMGNTDEQKTLYKTTATRMMEHRVNKEFGGDWGEYLKVHRFGKKNKDKPDPKYYKAYDDSLKKQYGEYIKRQAQRRQLMQKAAPSKVAQVAPPTVTGT